MFLFFVLSILLVFIIGGIGKVISVVASNIRLARIVKDIPKPGEEHWLFGHYLHGVDKEGSSMYELEHMVMPLVRQGHKVVQTRAGPGVYFIQLCHPDAIRKGAGSDPKLESNYAALRPWLGEGLLTSNGAKWSRHRRLLTNAFHYDILKSYIDVFSDCASIFISQVDKAASSDSSVVDIVPLIRLFTLDTLLRCICGQETNCQIKGAKMPYVESVYSLSTLTISRMFSAFIRYDWVYAFVPAKREEDRHCRLVHKFSENVIKQRRKEMESGIEKSTSKKYLDFIDVLLAAKDENGQGLTDFEIREQMDTFLFEGHDTTATSLGWILYLLAKHPEHQAKCREEVDALFDKKDAIEWDDLKELTYLHYFIKEAGRMHPAVPLVGRQLASSRTIDGHQLPKGIGIFINMYACHHNPAVWKDPEVFDPLRFTPENSKDRDPLAFIPFSAGPRNCIGQNFALSQEKVVLAMFLRTFELSLEKGFKPKPIKRLLMHAEKVPLKLKRR